MQDETTEEPPLKQAIIAMRSALDAAIREELDRLLTQPSPSVTEEDVWEDSGNSCEPAGTKPPILRNEVESLVPLDHRSSIPNAARATSPNTSNSVSPGTSESEGSDAVERRLDALALRLEGRLRRARDRDPHRPRSDDGSFPNPIDSPREHRP